MYLKFFGFREPPFNMTPDPRFFFDSSLHREAWATLVYGIKERKGFVVVTGEVGTGKTTLLRKLLRSLEATHRSVFIFNTFLSFDGLLETILRDLDLAPAPGRTAMVQQLNEFLLDQTRTGHVVSVLIDEAQNLDDDTLEAVRLLSNLETDRDKLLQITLVGQPELEAKLNSRALRQLKQRVSLWCHLDRLTQAETRAYIAHRLSIAGYEGTEIFSQASVDVIWERAAGIPRLINSICDNALVTAFAVSKKTVNPDIIREVADDLRLVAGSRDVDPLRGRSEELAQLSGKHLGNVAEIPDSQGSRRSRRAERREKQRLSRNTVEVVHNLGLKRETASNGTPVLASQEIQRPQSAAVAAFAELAAIRSRSTQTRENLAVTSERAIEYGTAAPSRSDPQQRRLVPVGFFDQFIAALKDAMGPIAPLVVNEQVAAFGASLEQFPVARLAVLIRAIKPEILNDYLRAVFEERVRRLIEEYSDRLYPVDF